MKKHCFSIIKNLFKGKLFEKAELVLLGTTISYSHKPQYYKTRFVENENRFTIDPVTRSDDWSLKVDFKAKGTVTVTIQGSPSLLSDTGIALNVAGNLVLKQTTSQALLSIYAHSCGIHVSGSFTSELDNMAIHCSHGPALLAGGNISISNISTLKLIGTEPTTAVQDISLTARPNTTADIFISGGLSAGGDVKIANECAPLSNKESLSPISA